MLLSKQSEEVVFDCDDSNLLNSDNNFDSSLDLDPSII